MANQEHLDRLKDIEAWNKWRAENPEIKPDLSEADLCGADLSGADLCGADLSGAILSKACLSWANLSKADLISANLSKAILNRANLSKAILGVANLSKANLNEANLRRAFLYKADLIEADLRKADLRKADLRKADLSNVNLERASLKGVNLEAANLKGVNLREINLSESDLSGADLRGAFLFRTNLIKSDLRRADLSGADLSYAKLNKCSISGATLYGANTYKWEIKGIICTHIFKEEKRIDYAEDEFEKAHTYIESVVEMILNAPYSFFTHFVGNTIEKSINEKYGKDAFRLVGQKAISDNETKLEFVNFKEDIEEIKKDILALPEKLKPAIEGIKDECGSPDIIGLKHRIDIPFTMNLLEFRPKKEEKELIKRYAESPSWLKNIIQVIQNTIKP